VIAVDLNSDLLGRHFRSGPQSDLPEVSEGAKPELGPVCSSEHNP
jgi:hypothetical protein